MTAIRRLHRLFRFNVTRTAVPSDLSFAFLMRSLQDLE